jgi:hypothetical protein
MTTQAFILKSRNCLARFVGAIITAKGGVAELNIGLPLRFDNRHQEWALLWFESRRISNSA